MQLIVLGMHRSGTSVLARMLNLMGAYFGAEGTSTGANKENPKGFWERRDVRVLNDDVLFAIGCDWNRISNLDLSRVPPAVQRDFGARAFQIVLDLDAHRPWMLKEPRLCLLLPMWQQVLELPVFIHIVRHPVEVAASLKTRNAIPLPVGLALWEQYNRHALAAAQGMPIITVQHRRLMMEPAEVASEVFGALEGFGVAGLRMPTHGELAAFVRPELYREREGRDDLRGIGTAQSRLFQQLAAGRHPTRLVDGALAKRQLAILREYEESLPAFTRKPSAQEQREEAHKLEMEMERLKKDLEARTLEHATLKGEFGMLREWIADAKDAQDRQVAAAEAARAEAAEELRKQRAERAALADQLSAARQALSGVEDVLAAKEQLLERTRADAEAESRRLQAVAEELRTELGQAAAAAKTLEASLNAELGKTIAVAQEMEAGLRSELQHAMAAAKEMESRFRSEQEGAIAARRAQDALQDRLSASAREIAMLTRRLLQAEETEEGMRKSQAGLHARLAEGAEAHATAIAIKSAESAALAEELELVRTQAASLQVRVKHAEDTIRLRDAALAASTASADKLTVQYLDARQAIDALLSSTSWRWSAPLRILSRLSRGGGLRQSSPVEADDFALLRGSSLFDADWYRRQYPDISASGVDPVEHYLAHGATEGRDPGPGFSTQGYLVRNPDVGTAGMNPLVHYLRYGKAEGRLNGLPVRSQT